MLLLLEIFSCTALRFGFSLMKYLAAQMVSALFLMLNCFFNIVMSRVKKNSVFIF